MNIVIGDQYDGRIEISERKGIGHPDTICDMVNERISLALSDFYFKEFGVILHHNVDKALLIGGQSMPAYGGGKIIKPITLIIAGRATHQVKDKIIPVEEIAIKTIRNWVTDHVRHLDVQKDLDISIRIRPGSADLVELFNRFGRGEVPLANDTSFGVGYYPTTPLENKIIQIETLLNKNSTKELFPFIGEDIKVMGVQDLHEKQFTISIAMVDKYISNLQDYVSGIEDIRQFLSNSVNIKKSNLLINTADDYPGESLFLTVSGTSAESGDDGQVGRGNRINGLITPYFPMSMEAISGKNPVSHVGKIYNRFAMDLSKSIVENNFAEKVQI